MSKDDIKKIIAERDALRAELAALKAPNPSLTFAGALIGVDQDRVKK